MFYQQNEKSKKKLMSFFVFRFPLDCLWPFLAPLDMGSKKAPRKSLVFFNTDFFPTAIFNSHFWAFVDEESSKCHNKNE
jgi:hypothetical protein